MGKANAVRITPLVLTTVLLCTQSGWSQQSRPLLPASLRDTARAMLAASTDEQPVAAWKVWRVFHDAISDSVGSSERQRAVVTALGRLRLSATATTFLREEGERYLRDIRALEQLARQEVQRRYTTADDPVGRNLPPDAERPVLLPRGMTLRAVVERDGLLSEFEDRFNARYLAHRTALSRALSSDEFNAIDRWVTQSVGTKIHTLTLGPVVEQIPARRGQSGYVAVPRNDR